MKFEQLAISADFQASLFSGRLRLLPICIVHCFLVMTIRIAVLPLAPAGAASSSDLRIIHCPKEFSLGTLRVIRNTKVGLLTDSHEVESKNALGEVSVHVPPGSVVKLELSSRVLRKPDTISCLKNDRIEQIRIRFLPMEESEDGLVDKALRYVSEIKSVESVNVDSSDATDVGMNYLKSLPKLNTISFFRSRVVGSCFEALSSCPHLMAIHAWHCTLDPRYLKFLPKMTKLDYLNLCFTGLHDSDLKSVGACAQLYNLRLGNDPITDAGMKYLSKLKKLNLLDLTGTEITAAGLKQLKGLPLVAVTLETPVDAKADRELRQLFPGLTINGPHKPKPSRETLELFAPGR